MIRPVPLDSPRAIRQAVGFWYGSVACQSANSALADEVRGGVILIEIREDWSERLARV